MNATSIKLRLIRLCCILAKFTKEILMKNPKIFSIFLGLMVFVSCSDAPNKADLILSSNNVIAMNAYKDSEALSIAISNKRIFAAICKKNK